MTSTTSTPRVVEDARAISMGPLFWFMFFAIGFIGFLLPILWLINILMLIVGLCYQNSLKAQMYKSSLAAASASGEKFVVKRTSLWARILVWGFVALVAAGMLLSANADARWEYSEIYDDMEEHTSKFIVFLDGETWVVIGCSMYPEGKNFYQRMAFDPWAFIGSDGYADMRVKYGDASATDETGWSVVEGAGGHIVERPFFNLKAFRKWMDRMPSSGRVLYRVTTYSHKTYDLAFTVPSDSDIKMIEDDCK